MEIFLKDIKVKYTQNIPVHGKLSSLLSYIGGFTKYVFIFDAEFQHVQRNIKHILEFGGIVFEHDTDKKWRYVANFHFNLPPIKENLGIIHSTFLTVTPATAAQMADIEKDYLFHPRLEELKHDQVAFIEYYYQVMNSPIVRKKNIPFYDPKTEQNKIIKTFKNFTFQLTKKDVGHDNWRRMWKLYTNDPLVKKRTLVPTKAWLSSFVDVLQNSVAIVKGTQDLVAIDNLLARYNIPKIQGKLNTVDIAVFNAIFRQRCDSAELEKSYWCLIEKKLIDPELKPYLKQIYKSLAVPEFTAHNPLVDSFYTLVVAVSMQSLLASSI
jgi:hypothetical protein